MVVKIIHNGSLSNNEYAKLKRKIPNIIRKIFFSPWGFWPFFLNNIWIKNCIDGEVGEKIIIQVQLLWEPDGRKKKTAIENTIRSLCESLIPNNMVFDIEIKYKLLYQVLNSERREEFLL